MIHRGRVCVAVGAATIAVAFATGGHVGAQQTPGHVHAPAATPAGNVPAGGPRRVSEDELHRHGGIPRGRKFSVPSDGKYLGLELTGMGRIHPRKYIAESILFPNAVIVDEPGTTGPDGLSRMPSYAESVSLTEWLDLVAYLKGLTEGGEHPESHDIERVATAGDYRIRLVSAQGHGGHAGHHGAPAAGHLMAFITERESGEAVPYLPVTATVQAVGTARRTITLRPMIGDGGFHYGADVALPERTTRLTLVVGPTTARVLAPAKGRYSKPATAVFDWGTGAK